MALKSMGIVKNYEVYYVSISMCPFTYNAPFYLPTDVIEGSRIYYHS
jgi:hypothetical protein